MAAEKLSTADGGRQSLQMKKDFTRGEKYTHTAGTEKGPQQS